MNKNKCLYKPGTILWFTHLHTNEVMDVKSTVKVGEKKLLELSIKGKDRPMLLLWEKEGAFKVLYMTSGYNKFYGKMVKNGESSFVDCSRYFEYNEKLIRQDIPKKKVKPKTWNKVLNRLPRMMRDMITYISHDSELSP